MHPRHSLLDLFDPLAFSATSRDAPSPDSDKENSSPPIVQDSDVFFGRVVKHPSPVRLKRRLIDVGDMTMDDIATNSLLTEEDGLDDSMCDDDIDTLTFSRLTAATPARTTFGQLDQHVTPSHLSPRTPLGELSLDCDITPVPRTKMYRRPPPSSLASSDAIPSMPSDSSSFASVIDAVTTSGTSFAGPVVPSPPKNYKPIEVEFLGNLEDEDPDNISTPQITITPVNVLSDSTSTLDLSASSETLLQDTSQPFTSPTLSDSVDTSIPHIRATLRPIPSRTSSQDTNRLSIDLQSSFQLQLQSEEASFDLLNDKISFFASSNGMDSFLSETSRDDSFDMVVEEANLQAAIEKIQLEEAKEKGSIPTVEILVEDCSPETQDPEPSANVVTQVSPPQAKPTALRALRRPSVRSTPVSPNFEDRSQSAPTLKPNVKTVAPVFVPSSPKPNAVDLRTHAPPAPVPALRIVKRVTRPGHEKTGSSSSTGSVASEVPPASTTVASATLTQKSTVLSNSRHVSSSSASSRTTLNRAVAPAPSAVLPPTRTGTGPRRVPIVDTQLSTGTTNNRRGFSEQKITPQISTIGPRRVIVTPSVPPMGIAPAVKVPAVSGLKAPTKYGVGAGAASSLPRPVSRLPTASASGIARPRATAGPGADTGGVRRAAAPTRRVGQ